MEVHLFRAGALELAIKRNENGVSLSGIFPSSSVITFLVISSISEFEREKLKYLQPKIIGGQPVLI